MAPGSGGVELGGVPQGGCPDPAWRWCVHPQNPMGLILVGLALLLLAAKLLRLCHHLSVSCWK